VRPADARCSPAARRAAERHSGACIWANASVASIVATFAPDTYANEANLPDELIMSSYFALRDGKIVSLAVIFNQPSPY
jgi:hypothetical protein